jgi:quercetin dioxygenase-like cupin family protein
MADREDRKGGAKLRGQVAALADLVSYQDDSVVSHQILNGNGGSVTLFAFDEGQGLSEHTTPFDALVQLVDGEAEVVIAGKLLRLKEGDLVVMPANEPHAVKAVGRFKMLLTMIKP